MSWPLLVGALFGGGLWLAIRGLWPRQPTLAEAFAELGRADSGGFRRPIRPPGALGRLGGLAASLRGILTRRGGAQALVGEGLGRDLAVVGRDVDDHVMTQLAAGGLAFILVGGTGALLWAGAGVLPLELPLGLALLVGLLATVVPNALVHTRAERRRAEVRHAVTALVQGTRLAGATGSGVDEALHRAAGIWDNWVFLEVRGALDSAALHGETPWAGLARLGRDMGIVELQELAEVFGLARDEGARVRRTLDARAATLQAHRLAEREAAGHRANVRMVFPVALIAYAFMVLLVYPFLSNILASSP